MCYISITAILGALLRMIMAQFFGEECANPGTIGWLSAASPLCVTKDGGTLQEGGIVFSDLPANILGSFIMGFFQNAAVLGITVPMAVAWLPPNHTFQSMPLIHKAITTGFCGSLTTFSSWNSEMVVMIFGTGNNRQTQVWKALFGYIIGTETAIGSLTCGKSLALRLFRFVNPTLSVEYDAAKEKMKEGIPINQELPDFERRYLPNLNMGSKNSDGLVPMYQQATTLAEWRSSTAAARRFGHPLLDVLTTIETTVLSRNEYLPAELESIAQSQGWALDALMQWKSERSVDIDRLPSVSSFSSLPETRVDQSCSLFQACVLSPAFAIGLLGAVYAFLLFLMVVLKERTTTMITYRTMCYALLLAPGGALTRWKLSQWNGKCTLNDYTWLPLGTFGANIAGSLISIFCVAFEYANASMFQEGSSFWIFATLRAAKIGFAGCLTTVSTFAAETSGFMHSGQDHAYPYIMITLASSCLLGCLTFGLTVSLG